MIIKVLTEAEALERNKAKTNNWAFRPDVIISIMEYKLDTEPVWDWRLTEIAKAQLLLSLYGGIFELSDNTALFNHIKNKSIVENDINYDSLQQYLVNTFYILNGEQELGHKKPIRQYMRDKDFFMFMVIFNNLISQKYIPGTSLRNLSNMAAQISTYALSQAMSSNAKNKDKTMREELLNEITSSPDFFKGCRDTHTKLARIIKASAKYPRKKGQKSPISEKTARRYLAKIEGNSCK